MYYLNNKVYRQFENMLSCIHNLKGGKQMTNTKHYVFVVKCKGKDLAKEVMKAGVNAGLK